MGIEIDFGRELGRLAFPDDITEEQAQGYVRENYQAIRQGLLTQRQEQLAAETASEEAAKLRAGDIGTLETVGGQLYEAPRAAGRMLGQAAKGFAQVFEGGAPDIEVTPEERAAMIARSPITQAGERLTTAAEELPVIPGVEQTIPGQIMGGVGSVLGLAPVAAVGGPAAAGAVYGLSAGQEALEDARRTINKRIAERLAIGDISGADDLRAQLPQLETAAFGLAAPIGAITEGALGLAGRVGRIGAGRPTIGGIGSKLAEGLVPKAASVRTQNMIRGGIEGAATEGLQESLEQTLGNMAAKVTYDPERGVMDGVAQAGFIGAATGGFVGGTVGSRKNLGAANAVAEATGADPSNPLPRATATLAGIQDGPQPTGPISIEPEVTPEEVLRMSQELGIPMPEEVPVVAPAPAPAPVTAAPVSAPAAPAPVPAPVAEAPIPTPVLPAAPGELAADEQAELDSLIEKEAAGTLTEDDSITLSAYRARLGIPTEPQTPTPDAIQEQGPNEGVLRREEPQPGVQVGLPQVDQGGRAAQGAGAKAQGQAEVQPLTIEETQEYNSILDAAQGGSVYDILEGEQLDRFEELAGRVRQLEQAGYEFDEATGWTKPRVVEAPAEPTAVLVEPSPTPDERAAEIERLKKVLAKTPAPVVQATPTPVAPAPAPAPKKQRKVSQVRQDAREFDRLAIDIAPDLGLIEDPTLLSPVFTGPKPDKMAIQAEIARRKAKATVLRRMIQALGANPEKNSEADRAALLPKMRERALEIQRNRKIQAFDAAVTAGGPVPINTSDLAIGDKITVGGSDLTITAIDPDTMDATADGGERYGEINLPDNTELTVDAFTPAPTEAAVAAPAAPTQRKPRLAPGQNQGDLIASTQAEPLALVGEEVVDLEARKRRQEEAARAAAEAKAAAEKAQTTMDFAQSAIDTIDRINKGLSENQYSDPLFLTPLAKLALQIAKRLIQAGVAVEQAIRQAIAEARQQLPNDTANDKELEARLVRDAQYTQAVSAGDMEAAQRMVDEAAKAAGYTVGPVYHGTKVRTKFTEFFPRSHFGTEAQAQKVADRRGRLYKVYLKLNNPAQTSDMGFKAKWTAESKRLKAKGHDGIVYKNIWESPDITKPDLSYVAFDPSQIKSADPVTYDDAGNVVPLSRRFQSGTADIRGTQSDSIESALQKVIAATDPRGKAFEAVTALSYVVLNQAAKIALAIYKRTKSWIAARNAGMDYIKSHVQLQNEPETAANFEEFIKGFPNEEIPAGTPQLPQPPNPAERVESRGLFIGDITRDTDDNWAAEARKWVDFYKGNLERAFQAAMTANIDSAFREYVFSELIQRSELEVSRAKNDVDLLRALNLQERIANAEVKLGADTGKAMAARKLSQERFWWLQPALIYRNLVRKRQAEAIPFPGFVSQQVRKWLVDSGREAVDQVREAMKQADVVFGREFRKIKQVPGAEGPIEINWRDILTKSIESQGNVRQKMLQVILADPRLRNLSPAGIAEITNLLTNAWEKQRDRIFTSEFRKKIPLPTIKPDNRDKLFRALPRILRYANIARATPGDVITTDGPETFLLWEQAFRDAVAPEFGVAEINGGTARKLTALAQDAQTRKGVNRNEIIQQMFRLMAREGGVNFWDALRDYWYAAVLSGTRTQVDNALNILNGALNTAMFATMAKGDAGFVAYSALKGLNEGVRDFWPMLWKGELYRSVNFNPDQPGNALEGLGESRKLFARGISQMKYVSRLIQALDHVTALMSDASAKAYALRKEYGPEIARQLMMPAPEIVAAARDRAIAEGTRPELVNKRTREILQEKFPIEILLTSKEIREATTFTEVPQGLMGSLYEGLNAASRKFPALKFVTGTNFVRFAANYTNELLNYAAPVAAWRWFQSAPGKSDGPLGLNYSESRRDLLLAKAAIGTALGAFAAAMFLGDDDKEEDRNIDITGSFKSLDPNKRKQLLAEGRQPYSIRFGNTYVSYRQLGFGGLLGAIGELRDRQLFTPEKWSKESITDKVLDAGAAGMFIVKDSSAISGLTEFLGFANAYKYDTNEVIEKAVPRYLARLSGSLVPNILKEVDAWSDPSIFKAEGGNMGYEYFLQQVPYARREIGPGPILNVLGEPVQIERYPYSRWVTQRQDDPAWDTLGRLASRGVFMPTPAITVKVNENGTRRELTREEKYQYQRAVGQGYRRFVEQNSKRLLALPPAQASDLIDKNAERIRRDAREKLQKGVR